MTAFIAASTMGQIPNRQKCLRGFVKKVILRRLNAIINTDSADHFFIGLPTASLHGKYKSLKFVSKECITDTNYRSYLSYSQAGNTLA